MNTGKAIKAYLECSGITQVFVAKKTGIPINTFNAMCNGKQKIAVEQYFGICEALGVPYEFFAEKQIDATA